MSKLTITATIDEQIDSLQGTICDDSEKEDKTIILYHNCLVSEYMSYMKTAGYSLILQVVRNRERGAWSFLAKFPEPKVWLALPIEEQLRCNRYERAFLHYLFLRQLLPMPPAYILTAKSRLPQMGIRLMEREAYQRYQQVAQRLEYQEQSINRQFRILLYLMSWGQKTMDTITLADLEAFTDALRLAYRELDKRRRQRLHVRHGLPVAWYGVMCAIRNVLYHLGIFSQRTFNGQKPLSFEEKWKQIPPNIRNTVQHYLRQLTLSHRPNTLIQDRFRLYRFFSWLAKAMPDVTAVNQIQRCHIEAFKEYLHWAMPLNHSSRSALSSATKHTILGALFYFLQRITEWQWPEAPQRLVMFYQDLPPVEKPLPKFLDEVQAGRFLQIARNHRDMFTKTCGVTLMLTGMRQSEFLGLTTDCMVQIGENYWLRIPIGKTLRDRYVPLHPEVKRVLDQWIASHSSQKRYDFLFTQHGRRIRRGKVALAVQRIGREACIPSKVTPHRLRHTLATLAINRGMPLESIAALLGHRSLSMTLVYAHIGNRTVQKEYSAVSKYLEQLCSQNQIKDTMT
ncbi:MAG: hypothetical protein FJZ93_10880, partial [Chloroflexi bacterium]|nr:hypothetical protein [Chloroflexota bacterium]